MTAPIDAVKEKYEKDGYIVLSEFAYGGRRIDAIALSPWEARKYALHLFELKSFREDWLRELHNPEKQNGFWKVGGDYWFLETEEGIIKPEEVPEGFGLMQWREGKSLKIIKEAEYKPPNYDISFLMAFLNKMRKYYNAERVGESYQRGYEEGKKDSKQRIDNLQSRIDEMDTKINKFRDLTGVNLWHDDVNEQAEAFNAFNRAKDEDFSSLIDTIKNRIAKLHECKKVLDDFEG
jgi:hypothetical protein